MRRATKKQDAVRLRSILDILVAAFDMPELDHLHLEDKLCLAFSSPKYEVYRRKICRTVTVRGLWWVDEDQLTRWAWQGHHAQLVRGDLGLDKVVASRSLSSNNTYCYIREDMDHVDLEVMLITTTRSANKRKRKVVREWLTCTITKDEYKRLDEFLGPREDICNHESESHYDFAIQQKV